MDIASGPLAGLVLTRERADLLIGFINGTVQETALVSKLFLRRIARYFIVSNVTEAATFDVFAPSGQVVLDPR